ncbi:MAG TPA: alpha-L-fucosidase [Propionibacteriaceae bacterium]|nr:alpha-L-fucosidase [Propionibacteriaceae bacterium]
MSDESRWAALTRQTPEWFTKAKLGIFVHWGPYSVPAWAEPIGELGTIEAERWFTHNPYAEWYFNTIRIEGSPAQAHHHQVWDDRPYDDFLDLWQAESFDARELAETFRAAGASYVVLTTKHHDGVTLWDAPGTEGRNTVARGPKRDLVHEWADGVRAAGLRFATYYSGGLDWYYRPFPPHQGESFEGQRPKDADYASYAGRHVRDLVERYRPDVLWNDIQWPDAGKDFGPDGIGTIFEEYYATAPEGLVNDRWNVPHHDFATSEYQASLENEAAEVWENTRGVGLSFGYNAVESDHAITGAQAARHLTDVVSRGGRLLLGVGPKADGTLPDWQRLILADLGRWMAVVGPLLAEVSPSGGTDDLVAGDNVWVRRGRVGDDEVCFVDVPDTESGIVELHRPMSLVTPEWATLDGATLRIGPRPGPVVLSLLPD